jgi:hypothetical protein
MPISKFDPVALLDVNDPSQDGFDQFKSKISDKGSGFETFFKKESTNPFFGDFLDNPFKDSSSQKNVFMQGKRKAYLPPKFKDQDFDDSGYEDYLESWKKIKQKYLDSKELDEIEGFEFDGPEIDDFGFEKSVSSFNLIKKEEKINEKLLESLESEGQFLHSDPSTPFSEVN